MLYSQLGVKQSGVKSSFHYSIGDITCESDSVDEFTENALGQTIDLLKIMMNNYNDIEIEVYFHIYHKIEPGDKNVSISCGSGVELERVLDAIAKLDKVQDENAVIATTQHNYTTNVVVKDNTAIHGSNIGGRHKNATNLPEKTSSFWQGVWQNIVSNLIWY